MDYKKILLVVFVNLCIAGGFFYDNIHSDATDMSADLGNIIPICKKLDNPDSFRNDLYLNDVNDVKYYTPAYVQSLRLMAKITNGDYIKALNLFSFFVHLIYGLTWFLLFYKLRKDFVMALVFSVFFRGILWPPGGELLGISQLWTAMPRTAFIALAPLPFLAYIGLKKYRIVVPALILGLILNFHPISGIGAIVCYFSIFSLHYYYAAGRLDNAFFKDFALAAFCCLLGMLPYLLTYLVNIKINVQYDENLFNIAFKKRLGDTFSDPVGFVLMWIRPIMMFLAAAFALFFFFDRSGRKKDFKILFFTILIVFITANGLVYLESWANHLLHKNIRMSFQLIRFQKFILVLLQIGLYLLLIEIVRRLQIKEKARYAIAVAFFALLSVCSLPMFSNVPLIGDDLMTSIYPDVFKVYVVPEGKVKMDMANMIAYIEAHTEPDAVLFGTSFIRSGAGRAVVLDMKGAGMLIEGNPGKFVAWYEDSEKFEQLDEAGKIGLLKSKKVTYIMSEKPWKTLASIKKIGKYDLYKL